MEVRRSEEGKNLDISGASALAVSAEGIPHVQPPLQRRRGPGKEEGAAVKRGERPPQ